ncbi:MAG: transposase, partial [Vallitaleaceae bacterium]|nr:transposase [Vallitaleaceae bacterium]
MLKSKHSGEFDVICYCLMNNHVHLLFKEGEQLGESIKRITVRYSHYYNKKYGRRGHLLNNRYRSEAIEDEHYLLNVFHYIHQNPIEAGIVKCLESYRWSSYHEYILFYKGQKTWIDTLIIKNYFENLIDFRAKSSELIKAVDIHRNIHGKLNDDELYLAIKDTMKLLDLTHLSKNEKMKVIMNIKMSIGGSNRQLSRILGVGRRIVDEACTSDK